MNVNLRWPEYKALLYRLFLGYFFYFVGRLLFYAFNANLFTVNGIPGLLRLCYYGLAFDTTALLYINSLFILLSVLPLTVNTRPGYQKGLTILYFVTNLLFFATNFIDVIYYRFSQVRSTKATLDLLADETNKKALFAHFSWAYWYVILVFVVCCLCWIALYSLVKVKQETIISKKAYFLSSAIAVVLVVTLMIGGVRGDFRHSTRPINMVDAYRHVTIPNQGDIVLNTPFAILRTLS
ncbi:MAG: LTA synthase family protein, partial [Mucilaginibacter sp.]